MWCGSRTYVSTKRWEVPATAQTTLSTGLQHRRGRFRWVPLNQWISIRSKLGVHQWTALSKWFALWAYSVSATNLLWFLGSGFVPEKHRSNWRKYNVMHKILEQSAEDSFFLKYGFSFYQYDKNMYVSIYTHIQIYIYMYLYRYIHTCILTHECICIYIYMYIYICVSTYNIYIIHIYIRIYVNIFTFIYTYTLHIYIYIWI